MFGERRDDVSGVLAATADVQSRVDPVVLRSFLEELFLWNPQLGLVSKREPVAVVVRLIRESVLLWDFVGQTLTGEQMAGIRRVLDVGSGAGFPGMVWRMLSPDREFLLIERKERKATFLERVIARTHLSGITAEGADLRELVRREDRRNAFDLAVMMAVADPAEVVAPIERILRTPGYFCTVRGRDQKSPGQRLGKRLHMFAHTDTRDGRFFIYQHLASEC
jgi:16S rRNA (guanine527-N7)-methyltransferase